MILQPDFVLCSTSTGGGVTCKYRYREVGKKTFQEAKDAVKLYIQQRSSDVSSTGHGDL